MKEFGFVSFLSFGVKMGVFIGWAKNMFMYELFVWFMLFCVFICVFVCISCYVIFTVLLCVVC